MSTLNKLIANFSFLPFLSTKENDCQQAPVPKKQLVLPQKTTTGAKATGKEGTKGTLKKGNGSLNQFVYAIPDSIKSNVAFNSESGSLYVTQDYILDSRFLSFKSKLERTGKLKHKKVVSIKQLLRIQRNQTEKTQTSYDSQKTTQGDVLRLFNEAYKLKASDIHINVYRDIARVLIRVNGSLQEMWELHERQARNLCATIYQSLADPGASDATYNANETQDARISNPDVLPKGLHGVRIASGPHVDGIQMVLRLLYSDNDFIERRKSQGKRTRMGDRLKYLGYSESQIKKISFMVKKPTGINIVAGPTGSGKSTTLMHCMEAMAEERPDKHYLTVEDPPEYAIRGCIQKPVTDAANEDERRVAFSKAMRSAMRHDPDVIMVGEIRDRSTARTAIEAAMTGHQVLTTLHANSAFNIINRLIDLLISTEISDPISMIADDTIMSGLMFQRLVKKMCPDCKIPLESYPGYLYKKAHSLICSDCKTSFEKYKDQVTLDFPIYQLIQDDESICLECKTKINRIDVYPVSLINRLDKVIDSTDKSNTIFLKGDGCGKCHHTGVTGRTVVAEVVTTDPEMMRILRFDGVETARRYWIEKQGGSPIMDHVISKVKRGEIDPMMAEDVVGPLTTALVMKDNTIEADEYSMLVD